MNDFQSVIDSVFALAYAHKWWLVSAAIIGAGVRISKPDVTLWVLKRFNLDARWRPVLAAALGIVVSFCDMIVSGSSLEASLKWGMSAAMAAMMTHTFGIEVLRDGRELGEPKAGQGRFSHRPSGRPPAGGEGVQIIELTDASPDVDPNPMPSSFPKTGKYPPNFRCASLWCASFALVCVCAMGCASVLPIVTEVIRDVSDATLILDAIATAEKIWFVSHPADELQAKIDQALTDARLALATALRATRGAKEMNEQEFDTAFSDFRAAYSGLQALLREAGIVRASGRISVARGGSELVLPEPLALARRHP